MQLAKLQLNFYHFRNYIPEINVERERKQASNQNQWHKNTNFIKIKHKLQKGPNRNKKMDPFENQEM